MSSHPRHENFMHNGNLYSRLISAAKTFAADRPFLLTPGREIIHYRELDDACARLHARLATLGVKTGDRLMAQVDKSPEAVLLYLSCLRAGAVYIPLNTAYTSTEVTYFLSDARPSLFVCAPDRLESLKPVIENAGNPRVATLGDQGDGSLLDKLSDTRLEPAIRHGNDLAVMLYTSGTTGRAKGAMLSHDNLRHNTEALHGCWQWDDRHDVLLHALPIFHVHGLFVALHCALLGGSPIHLLPRFDIDRVIERLPQCSVMMGVPTFYTRLLDTPRFSADHCRNMRLFVAGSAPLLANTHQAFEARTGHRILERYGMTETGMLTSNPYDGERVAGSVGHALPGVSLRLADTEGKPLPSGETGILEVKGPNVFRGYWGQADKTAAAFRDDGWFITGDLATIDDDGRVSLKGRADDLIISGGYNIYPKEIESAIDAIDGVHESAVIGVPDADLGERVIAIVVAESGRSLEEHTLLECLSDRLARYKQPRRIYIVDALPRNSMGKVQKTRLRKHYRDLS